MRNIVKHPLGDKPWFVFQWHITDACDQRCAHCYIYGEDKQKKPETASTESLLLILDKCLTFCEQRSMRPAFCITGGDPLLHPDFWDFAAMLKQVGAPFTIMGNPFHLTSDACKRLKKLGCRQYQMSVDGLEQTHDLLRKPGSYRETMEKIALLNRMNTGNFLEPAQKRSVRCSKPDARRDSGKRTTCGRFMIMSREHLLPRKKRNPALPTAAATAVSDI